MSRPIVLYSESRYPDDLVEKAVYGNDIEVRWRDVDDVRDLDPADCADVEGLAVMRHGVTAEDFKKFPKLRCVLRMGVGYDKVDRKAAEAHNVMVCNVPDYGTTEVADHAMALALSLRRGVLLHHEAQRRPQPAPWRFIFDPLVRRSGIQTFGM